MSDAYRESAADAPTTGERLWSRSARGSILAIVFIMATALVGVWLYVSDPRNAGPPAFLLGGFSVAVLVGWVFSSHNAIVAIFERGLRVGWLGGRTEFVPWEEVTRVEDVLARRGTQYNNTIITETARVHCRGEVYAVSDRFVGGKSFVAARKELRAHVRPECFEHSAVGFDPPTHSWIVGVIVLWLSALCMLGVAVGLAHDTWIALHDPRDPSGGITLHAVMGVCGRVAMTLAPYAAFLGVGLWIRAGRRRARKAVQRRH